MKDTIKSLLTLSIGDIVIRTLGAQGLKMRFKVIDIKDNIIMCRPENPPAFLKDDFWRFSNLNGAEIDPELGWDETNTGSYISVEGDTTERVKNMPIIDVLKAKLDRIEKYKK
jgi:hypothetical protein